MNQPTSKSSYPDYTSGHAEHSFLELVAEMKALGMNPLPILETAANDILAQHGANVLVYTKAVLDQMRAANNPNGIYLWDCLHSILSARISPSYITIH